MTAHIAFYCIPALGHVYPSLAVAAELVQRGHRVSYATVAERTPLVEASGARVVPYRSQRPSDTDPGRRVPGRDAQLSLSLLAFLTEAVTTLPQLEPAFLADRPDMVVFDRMAFAGRVLAEKYDVPAVQLWPMLLPGPQWSTARMSAADRAHPAFQAYWALLTTFLADHGLRMHPDEFLAPPVRRHVAFFPRAFQPGGAAYDDSHCFVGPCFGPRPVEAPWLPPPGGAPVVLVTLGTIHNRYPEFYRTCFRAFAGTGWHVVLPVGRRLDPADFGRPPPNVEVTRWVPQLDALAHADAFVSHGGMGGVMEALWTAVPQVAIARTAEQELNAARVAQLHAGVQLSTGELTAPGLRAAVDRVASDPDITFGVMALAHELLGAGGVTRAADAVEACLPAGVPVRRADRA
jgi:MGT family glycosyltransferase